MWIGNPEKVSETAVQLMLLSLLPPSCMVVPIGNTANKFISPPTLSTTIMSCNLQTFIPTVNKNSNMGMDKSTGTNPINNSDSRGRTSGIERNLSRDTFMSSTCSSVPYHERVTMNNGMDIDSDMPTEFPALSYEEEQKKELRPRKAARTTTNMRPSPFREIMEATFQMIEYEVKLQAMMMLMSSTSNFPTIQIFP